MKSRTIRMLGISAFLVLLVLGLMLAGCGDGTSTTAEKTGASTPTATSMTSKTSGSSGGLVEATGPCDMVTKADVAAIMGEAVNDSQRKETYRGEACSYTSVAQPPRVADLTVIEPCSMADYANLGMGEPVEGIGMHAAWDKSLLYVHTMQNACLIVSGGGSPRGSDPANDLPALENAKQVALMLIDRMAPGSGM